VRFFKTASAADKGRQPVDMPKGETAPGLAQEIRETDESVAEERTEDMTNAWMVRNDGLEVPVTTHVYGTPESEYHIVDDENTYVATFLIKYGKDVDAPIDRYFKVYFAELLNQGFDIAAYVKGLPYSAVFKDLGDNDYLLKLWDRYKSAMPYSINEYDIAQVNRTINHELNQTFLRARIGGRYDTVAGNKDAYFRISSTGFRWNGVMDRFLKDRRARISTVTIERDHESTGSNKIYITRKNSLIDHMPLEIFLHESEDEVDAPRSFGYTRDAVYRYGPRWILRQWLREGMTMNKLCADLFDGLIERSAIDNIYAMWTHRENARNPKW
jgi:hypothetical protein